MVNQIDDQMISRWLDNELENGQAAELQRALRNDPTIAARADELRGQDDVCREWFEGLPSAPPPGIEHGIRAGFAARRTRHHRAAKRQWWLPAAAAAAVLIVGFAGFNHLIDRRVAAALDQMRAERASDMALLASAMQEVLETRESGVEVSFRNAATGLSVTMIPRRTWKSASGHWCREFAEAIGNAPIKDSAVTIACRTSNGRWKRIRTELPGGQVPLPLVFPGARDL